MEPDVDTRGAEGISEEMVRELGIAPWLVQDDDFARALRERLHGIGDEVFDEQFRRNRARYLGENHEQLVRDRAHAIWLREGRPEGRALENWLQAERELRDEVLMRKK